MGAELIGGAARAENIYPVFSDQVGREGEAANFGPTPTSVSSKHKI